MWTQKKLMDFLNITEEEANDCIGIVRGTIKIEADKFPKTSQWLQLCYNPPSRVELKMEALNELLCGCGIEPITDEDIWGDRYHGNIIAAYINFGDAYCGTILYDTRREKFTLTSWGDFVESVEAKKENSRED